MVIEFLDQFMHHLGTLPIEFSLDFMNVDLPKGASIELLVAGEVKS